MHIQNMYILVEALATVSPPLPRLKGIDLSHVTGMFHTLPRSIMTARHTPSIFDIYSLNYFHHYLPLLLPY